jgi:hypothetical protein
MAYFEMHCGPCDSNLTLDADEDMDTVVLDLVHRFTKSHEECGFVVPSVSKEEEQRKRLLQPTKKDDTE